MTSALINDKFVPSVWTGSPLNYLDYLESIFLKYRGNNYPEKENVKDKCQLSQESRKVQPKFRLFNALVLVGV